MSKAIFLVAALATVAHTASAQSSVTIYGNVDAAVTRVKVGNGSTLVRLDSGVGPGGRLGFRGAEDLGDGLRANFTLESGFAADTGTLQQGGLQFGRQVWVGLSSTSGWSMSAGRQYSPMALALLAADAQGNAYWGNLLAAGNGLYQSPASAGSDPGFQASGRVNNSVAASWTRSGWTARGMIAAGDENDRHSGQLASASLSYGNGPLLVTVSGVRGRQFAKDIPTAASPAWQNEAMLGASYDFGPVKVFAGTYLFDPSEANKTLADATLLKTRSRWIGGRVPLPHGTLLGQFTRADFDFPGGSGRGQTVSLAYEYPLSKRTMLYASTARLLNDGRGVSVLFGAVPVLNYPAVAGTDVQVTSFGLRHSF